MKYHKSFDLYRRKTKSGKSVYYVRFYNEDGNRTTAKSTGQTTKSAANTVATRMLRDGQTGSKRDMTFGEFAKDWWIWDRCEYIKRQKARGRRLGEAYAKIARGYLENHILPYFRQKKLIKMTTKDVEDWLLALREDSQKRLNASTINNCLTRFKTMMREAQRLQLIQHDPTASVAKLSPGHNPRGVLCQSEIGTLFKDDHFQKVWNNNKTHYTLNLVAAYTGLRLGELQALQVKHIQNDSLVIEQSWARKYGLTEPKWGSQRIVPIPPVVQVQLNLLLRTNTSSTDEDFVFQREWTTTVPVSETTVLSRFYRALRQIGIMDEERKERNITFHSWRHTFNSSLRSHVPDYKLQLLTGHRTDAMTNHYTHVAPEDLDEVRVAQQAMFGHDKEKGA